MEGRKQVFIASTTPCLRRRKEKMAWLTSALGVDLGGVFLLLLLFEKGSGYVAWAGLKLLGSNDPPASADPLRGGNHRCQYQ
jgi:hypothetical protein